MDELTISNKHRRKPIIAAIFLLLVTGLGYVYCGRIVKGIVFVFLGLVFVPIVTIEVLAKSSQVSMVVIGISLLISLLIWLVAIIDSYYIARRTRLDYELKEYNRWYVYVIFIVMSTVTTNQIALNIKSNLLEAFRTSSSSMFPTIEVKDRFLANKIAYNKVDPQRGDVVIFVSPENRQQTFVKRIVAVAGDTVEIEGGELYINGERLEIKNNGVVGYDDPNKRITGKLFTEKNGKTEYMIFISDTNNEEARHYNYFPKKTVPAHHCFVLGDNRNLSMDSRHFGPVPLATVKGRAEYLYWPVKDWSRFGPVK